MRFFLHTCVFLKEDDPGVRWICVLNNVADQLYYPCEHIAWAADAELIKIKSDKWWLFSTVLWGASLLLGILRSDITCQQTRETTSKNGVIISVCTHLIRMYPR